MRTNIPKVLSFILIKADLSLALYPFVVFKILKREKADLDEFDDSEYLTL